MTSASRGRRAFGLAAGLVVLANLAAGWRMPATLTGEWLFRVSELERRALAVPHKQRVRVLVLGNSHGMANMRVPLLAAGLGVAPDAIFNLSLPAATALENYLLLRRLLPLFPRVAIAPIVIDEMLVGRARYAEPELRFLTRFDPVQRLAIAPWMPDLDHQVTLQLGLVFPLLDQPTSFRAAITERPLDFLKSQWDGQVRLSPQDYFRKVRAYPYPWGYPPVWDVPGLAQKFGRQAFSEDELQKRARDYTEDLARAPLGFRDLAACCTLLERQGIRTVFLEPPVDAGLRRMLAREPYGKAEAGYRRVLQAFLQGQAGELVRPSADYPRDCFVDADHMSPRGARRFIGEVARALRFPR